jgi:hypothetical protein
MGAWKMDDDLAPLLSPKAIQFMELFKRHNFSMDALRTAHPEITPGEIIQASVELMEAMELFTATVPRQTAPASKRKKKKKAQSGEAYQLKITLRGSKPPIWRRVVVPAEIRLDLLHEVIQTAMGWYNCHLHFFEIDGEMYQGRAPDGFGGDDLEGLDEADYRLCDVVAEEKAKFQYEYDFGDGWGHTITLEKIIPASEQPQMMTCLAGKNRCPMEDSGGLWGYYDKLRIIGDPDDPEHEDIMEWMGPVDPTEFDREAVNAGLAVLK